MKIMWWIDFLFAGVAICSSVKSVDTEYLPAVSCHRKSYEPRTEVRALFSNEDQENPEIPANANVIFQTKAPTVNLINFDPISSVHCSGFVLTIDFDNLEGAQTALSAWASFADEENLVMIAAPQHGCGGVDMAFMDVKNLRLEGKVMKASQFALEPKEVILEYKLDLAQEVPRDRLAKRDEFERSLPLNMNFNGTAVESSKVDIFNNENGTATCIDCHVKGKTVFRTNIAGAFDEIYFFKLDLEGELTANYGLNMNISALVARSVIYKTIWQQPLTPLSIGGLFILGPKIALEVGAGIATISRFNVQMELGHLIHFPFKFGMELNGTNMTKPSFQFEGKPEVIPRMPKLTRGTIAFTMHLAPKIAVGFTAFGKGIELGLKLDNFVGIRARSPGCKEVPIETSLFRVNMVQVELFIMQFYLTHSIWSSDSDLMCPFCKQCPKK